jgi:hypothetical protein
MGRGADRDGSCRGDWQALVTDTVPIAAIIDVSLPQPTRSRRLLSLFADVALAILLVLAIPLVLIAICLPFVWLGRVAARLVGLF